MADYRLTRQAVADLADIWTLTARTWSAGQADRYNRDLLAAIEGQATGERRGRPVEDRKTHLKYLVGSHFVVYRAVDAGLLIVRILHKRMDVGRHL